MVEFTPAILAHLMIVGYKALKVENNGNHIVVEPLKDDNSIENFKSNNAYAISIGDPRAFEMTGKILLLKDMKFYIDQRFIQ